ncbi:uroporphyrinogen-III synthase [uncultured Sulfitobacter sp.]|uniref:uroporphyrinogen-III synthase n=1 Tax=Sulfitobacter sp. SH22 TaxID=3421172 RepID=UPI0025D30BC1|nr:uroporphyrinogen-III synthase [uncultured Sulfitobacter sp.]
MTLPVLIMTRPALASQRFVDAIKPEVLAKLALITSPLLKIMPTDAVVDLTRYRGVIFTSANGVDHAGNGDGFPGYCVGARTAEAARQRGWNASVLGQNADELIENLIKAPPPAPLLHIGGVHQRGDIAARLTAAGVQTDVVAVYDQQLLPLSMAAQTALAAGIPCIVPLFSPRTATQFVADCANLHKAVVIALSDAVAKPLAQSDIGKLVVADCPNAASMHIALETAVDWATLP